jgi:GrpB-like predicted nucleotidyltransferase (UPF0157 family)
MSNPLYELKKDDWNRLFPIHLEDHNPEWGNIFEKEKALILSGIERFTPELIEHVGSTSIPGIKAKPYIDLLVVIPKTLLFNEELIEAMEGLGYTYFLVPAMEDIEAYMSFGKGYNLSGEKEQIFHIHMCPADNFMVNQLAFRDFLRFNPQQARAYENLKKEAAIKYRNDRGGYRNSKSEFIRRTLDSISNNRN